MSQKFILFSEKTSKKTPNYEQQRHKRFTRKRVERQRSFDSKKSREDMSKSHYIKNPTDSNSLKSSKILDQTSLLLEKLSRTYVEEQPINGFTPKRNGFRNTTTDRSMILSEVSKNPTIEALEAEIELRNHEAEVHLANIERFEGIAEEQKKRRKQVQAQKKQLLAHINEVEKKLQEMELQNKKIYQEKEYLARQVEFLEKITYDEKTVILQSFRQKYLEKEIQLLRLELRKECSEREMELLEEMEKVKHRKYVSESKLIALNSYVSVIQKKMGFLNHQLDEINENSKEKVLNSEEYVELRQKYKRFLVQYKELRAENWNLKTNPQYLYNCQTRLELSDED